MAAWHEDARFHIFTDCDVFIEGNGTYLYVENEAFDYYGDYTCCIYYERSDYDGTKWYGRGDHVGCCNEYINKLEKAPWDIAKSIITSYLVFTADHEDDEDKKETINDAKNCLTNYTGNYGSFTYC